MALRTFYDAVTNAFVFRIAYCCDENATSGSFTTPDPLTAKIVFLVLQRILFWIMGTKKRMADYVGSGAVNATLLKGEILQRNYR